MSNDLDQINEVQKKVGERIQEVFNALNKAEVPQDDWTIIAMQTLVMNRLMMHGLTMMAQEQQNADRTDAILQRVAEERQGKGNRFEI